MKNIHILPSKKPSRLIFDKEEKCFHPLQEEPFFMEHQDLVENRNLYITCDEEIMNGYAYYPELNEVLLFDGKYGEIYEKGRQLKVILTKDQDLIKDGVQQIPDKFLNWFVKNPSCKEVEVIEDTFTIGEMSKLPLGTRNLKYKIIIPKEESKHPKVLSENGNELFFDEDGNLIKEIHQENVKETLEEDAEIGIFADKKYLERLDNFQKVDFKDGVFEGAKWQKGKMYSEEDLLSAFEAGMRFIGEDKGSFKEWFGNFKNKQ